MQIKSIHYVVLLTAVRWRGGWFSLVSFQGHPLILRSVGSVVYQNKDVKMMRLLRIHITCFAICFSVCPTGTRGISNIFKNFPLFDVSVTSNDTSLDVLNVTIHQQGILRLDNMWYGHVLSIIFLFSNQMPGRFAPLLYCYMAPLTQ